MILLNVLAFSLLPFQVVKYPKLSPFEALTWKENIPHVLIGERWFIPVRMQGVGLEETLAFCRKTYGKRWKKRFSEDLVQVFGEMGTPLEDSINLELRDVETGKISIFEKYPMTKANRLRILKENIRLELSKKTKATPVVQLTSEMVEKDLAYLEKELEQKHAYFPVRQVDAQAFSQALLERYPSGLNSNQFAWELQKLLAQYGDGHTRISGMGKRIPDGFLPEMIVVDGNRAWLLNPETGAAAHASFPMVIAIDDVSIDVWIKKLEPYFVNYSDSFRNRGVGRYLTAVNLARTLIGREPSPRAILTLAGADKSMNLERTLVSDRPRSKRRSPEPRLLEHRFGYLPIQLMDNSEPFLKGLHAAMEKFKETDGLIIDVRGNPGGSREPLIAISGYLAKPGEYYIANVAAFRRDGIRDPSDGFLQNRFLYPITASRFDEHIRSTIDNFAKSFKPAWKPPSNLFSRYHYFVLEAHIDKFRYENPVVVLADEGCFSAADIFVAGMKTLPNVRVVGRTTSGGSGRAAHRFVLPHSKLMFQCSTMISFQPNGQLFDGVGVAPDVEVSRNLINGKDSQLEAALSLLRGTEP